LSNLTETKAELDDGVTALFGFAVKGEPVNGLDISRGRVLCSI
jgi:hypothetical protein